MPIPKSQQPEFMLEYVQAPPFCLQVELTEGCNLRCSFCGLNGIRGKENNFKFMTRGAATQLIDRLLEEEWVPRIEFAMHGEPSANHDMIDIVRDFRERLPKQTHLMMTSNGYGFLKDPTRLIDEALLHLNVLALDWYQNVMIVPKILEHYQGIHTVLRYPQNKAANPHKRSKPHTRRLVIIQDIAEAEKGVHATLNNHAGCGSPKNENAQGKRCAKPFRELSIRWDGSVAVCCNDWRGEYHCGDIWQNSLAEIWHGPAMVAARRKLYQGQRDFGPCQGCDALSYRPGLLPDQRGKATMAPPTAADQQTVAKALQGDPLTLPVLRPWEVPVVAAARPRPSAKRNPAS